MTRVLLMICLMALAACASRTPVAETPELPVTRWDHRPEAAIWTRASLSALQSHGAVLSQLEPSDIDAWCPAYREADIAGRNAFWTGLFSALAKHESTWNPVAVGGGGLWIGLVQIDPRTAGWHQCEARSVAELKDGAANLACGVRIAANQVPKKNSVSRGMRDWGPFHSASKRAEMQAWVSSQAYCQK